MDVTAILADATAVADLIELAIKAGAEIETEVAPLVGDLKAVLSGTPLTADQRNALIAQGDALRARLNAPQPGDPA